MVTIGTCVEQAHGCHGDLVWNCHREQSMVAIGTWQHYEQILCIHNHWIYVILVPLGDKGKLTIPSLHQDRIQNNYRGCYEPHPCVGMVEVLYCCFSHHHYACQVTGSQVKS